MKKIVFSACTAILLVCLLASCGIRAPSERELIQLIPDEIIRYTLEGEECAPKISQLEILRQQLSEKDCIVECKLSIEDENLSRQEYIQLNCTYWDKGGWGLESWEELQRPEYTPLVPFDEDRFLAYFENLGYSRDSLERCSAYDEEGYLAERPESLFDGLLTENTPTHQCSVYQIQDVHPNLTVSGMALINGTFIMTAEFPRRFHWYIEADTSCLSYDWTVSGKWHCEFTKKIEHWFNYVNKQYSVDVDLQLKQGHYEADGFYYPVQGDVKVNAEDTVALHEWDYTYWNGETSLYATNLTFDLYSKTFSNDDSFHCRVRFYPDYAEVAIVKSNWDGEYETGTTCSFYRI